MEEHYFQHYSKEKIHQESKIEKNENFQFAICINVDFHLSATYKYFYKTINY